MNKKELKEKNKPELLALAARLKITGRHRMNKDELATAVAQALKKSAAAKKGKPKTKAAPPARTRKTAATKTGTATKTKSRITTKTGAAKNVNAAPQLRKTPTAKKPQVIKKHSAPSPRQEEIPDTQWQEDVERAKHELFAAP
jgi:hypothetical protein